MSKNKPVIRVDIACEMMFVKDYSLSQPMRLANTAIATNDQHKKKKAARRAAFFWQGVCSLRKDNFKEVGCRSIEIFVAGFEIVCADLNFVGLAIFKILGSISA